MRTKSKAKVRPFGNIKLLVVCSGLLVTTIVLAKAVQHSWSKTVAEAAFSKINTYSIGWYHYILNISEMDRWAASGANTFLAWPATFDLSQNRSLLDHAQSLGAQVFMSVHTNTWDASKTNYVNSISSHPALAAWYLRDEPQESGAPPAGEYEALHAAPVNLPAGIVHYSTNVFDDPRWRDQTDILMLDYYPGYSRSNESYFDTTLLRSYDQWVSGVAWAKQNNKDFIAVVQGFNDNYLMSEEEYRYHVLTAIVAGSDGVLFWHCNEGDDCPQYNTNSTLQARIDKIISYVVKDDDGILGKAMKASEVYDNNDANYHGVNDPRVSTSATSSQLAYRYGFTENKHVILAANISNRNSSSGSTLSNVRFSFPGVATGTVTVLGEGRTLPITNGSFYDDFQPFRVHAYSVANPGSSPTIPLPTNLPTVTPRPTSTPSPIPTATPRPTATPIPTLRPTSVPTPINTSTPTPRPTATLAPSPVPTSTPVQPGTDFRGEYFNNRFLGGVPSVVRDDAAINFDWGYGSPDPRISSDRFSARWTTTRYFEGGRYVFDMRYNDGVRVYIDNKLIRDKWYNNVYWWWGWERTWSDTFTTNIDGGNHEIKVEYNERVERARVRVEWRKY